MSRTGIDSRRFFTKVSDSYLRPPSTVPDPDLILTTAGLAFSGGLLTTWTASTGQVFTATATAEPTDGGPLLNSKMGMLCGILGGRAVCSTPIVAGSSSSYTFEVVMWPENSYGAGDREYIAYFQNGVSSPEDHLVFPHQANISGFNQLGVYVGPTWHYIDTPPSHKPQVLLYTFTAGAARAYRNGVFLDVDHDLVPASKFFDDMNIGGSYGTPPVGEGFKGTIYQIRMWCNVALSTLQAASEGQARLAEFAIDPDAYYPDDSSPASITLWTDSRDKRGPASAEWDGTASLALWSDQGGDSNHWQQGTAGTYPAAGARIAGRPTVKTTGDKWMSTSAISALFGTGADKTYSAMTVIRPLSITSTQATTNFLRDVVLGDGAGFWAIVLFLNSGVATVGLYHYASATYFVSDIGIAIGTPVLLHAYYDGTTVSLRVGNRTAVTVAAPSVSNLASAARLCNGAPTSVKADVEIAEVLFRNDANTTIMNNDRAYFGRIYGVSV